MNNISNILDECESLLQNGDLAGAIMKLAPISFKYQNYEDYVFLKLQLIDTRNEEVLDDFKNRIKKAIPTDIQSQGIMELAIARYGKYRLYKDSLIYRIPVNQKKVITQYLQNQSNLGPIVQKSINDINMIFMNIENAIRDIVIEYKSKAYCFNETENDHGYLQIINIIEHFGEVARQLTHRHDNRQPFEINDEYDVQDLFHALLRLCFDDVRPEDVAPSHAGVASRMDFLIKELQIVVEIKYATDKLRNKQLIQQLAEDKEQYKSHPNAKKLLCFVYDPNHKVDNPRGFENDLRQDSPLATEVFVRN